MSSCASINRTIFPELSTEVFASAPTARTQAQPLWQQFVIASGIRIVPCPRKSIAGINAKDTAIVAAAVSAAATHFVTGDKRLLAEMRATKSKLPQALTPREMLEALLT